MAIKREHVLSMQGTLPVGFDPGIPDGLIRDARVLLDFEESQLKAIREDLNKFPGFLEGTETQKSSWLHTCATKNRAAVWRG